MHIETDIYINLSAKNSYFYAIDTQYGECPLDKAIHNLLRAIRQPEHWW